MSEKDCIPRSDGDFLEWAKVLIAYARKTRTGWDSARQLTYFEAEYAEAENLNRSAADVLAKKKARTALETKVRSVVSSHLAYGDTVTDDDRMLMRLLFYDKKPTSVPAPRTYPTC